MTNAEIAAALDELGVLYELDGAVRYRVLAYSTAAKAIRESPVSVEELARAGRATEIPGVGKTLAEKITALLDTGEIPAAVKLKAKFPATLVEVTRVPGVGPKTARLLWEELQIASLEDLKKAAEEEKIRDVKGLGPKAEESMLASLERLGEPGEGPGRLLLSTVRPIAKELAEALREHPGAHRVEVAGSVRRWAETCKDIDLIATADEPKELAEFLANHALIAAAGKPGPNGVRAQTHNGVSVDLRIVPPAAFGNLLQHFTGSQAHNVQLREDAVKRGLSVSEHGITDTESGETTLCETEHEVYQRLGYEFIEPEMREGRGELKAAREGKLPRLIELDDVRGDLHAHTVLSDGRNTLAEMAAAGRERGYAYMAITDHSASHGFGDDVQPDRLRERIEEVRVWNEENGSRRFHLLVGSEINIGLDGSLDYPDDLVAELDWVVASVHTSFNISEKDMTARVVTAIEDPNVDCIGHLTGRLIGRREPYGIDVEAVAEAAARTGTMIEINGNPNRRDLSDRHARLAADAGVRIVLNTDAHGVDTLDNMAYAVATARRAWLIKADVANTRTWAEFKKLLK
ncbi:MAG TPA: DNA polymerase/3'-5' exonuclease PolX [Solirubrobacterales bacterium]|jgi:DNA polymerase (family 10)|nr:DNA polymerase/3'-5' exonuclease PolX [Solirubrobacterales bacterium]